MSPATTSTGLSSPTTEITTLSKGWYAISMEVANLPAAADCVSIFRYKVGYGGCTDINANNFDPFAKYDNQGCQYDCPPTTEQVTIGNTREACMKTVSIGPPQPGDTINWVIGDRTATGPGPHLAMAEEYVTVYRENSRTRCSTSGETYIDATDCIVESANVPGTARNYNTIQGETLLGTLFFDEFMTLNATSQGGCTNPNAYNFDCNALWDNGTCIEPIFGCTSSTAVNYDPDANVDDGSCFEGIQGCCEPQAPDYNPLANICTNCSSPTLGDDGSIIARIKLSSFGPPCENNLNDFIGDATSSELVIDAIEFVAGMSVVQIPPGMKIRAYRIPVGGNTIQGYSVNDIQFPMEDSGWPVECTWTLTGTDRSPVNAAMDDNGLLTYITETGAVFTQNLSGNDIYSLSNTTWIGDGSIGYGPHIFEITVPSPAGGKYHGRAFVQSPVNASVQCNMNGLELIGTKSVGCTDQTASNYNPTSTLNNFAAANVGANLEFYFPYRGYPNFGSFNPGYTQIGGVSNNVTLGNVDNDDTQFVCTHHYGNGPASVDMSGLPCIPDNMFRKLKYINRCISNGSINWFNNHLTGRDTKCEERKLSIMSFIKYLLERQGLECVFNCADSGTKDFHAETCEERWEAGGSKVWTYDSTGMGNNDLITNDMWYFDFSENGGVPPVWLGDNPPNLYFSLGRVIPDSFADDSTDSPFGDSAKVNWYICVDQKKFTETTNYLDNFFKFAATYCETCGPCQYIPGNRTTFLKAIQQIVPTVNVSDSNSLRIGGISLTLGEEEFS